MAGSRVMNVGRGAECGLEECCQTIPFHISQSKKGELYVDIRRFWQCKSTKCESASTWIWLLA